jgi:hypothetical protein
MHGSVSSWTVAPFQKSPGRRKWFDRHQNCVGEVPLHYGFYVSLHNVGVAPRKLSVCSHSLTSNSSPLSLIWKTDPWSLSKHFWYILFYIYSFDNLPEWIALSHTRKNFHIIICPQTFIYVNNIIMYKVVQIWPGQTVTCLHTNSSGHIWTTLYYVICNVYNIYS